MSRIASSRAAGLRSTVWVAGGSGIHRSTASAIPNPTGTSSASPATAATSFVFRRRRALRNEGIGAGSPRDDLVKIGVLTGSLLAAALATVVLRIRNRVYRRMAEEEQRDTDRDGIPDVYQHDDAAADRPTE